jgi:hypothetical protein
MDGLPTRLNRALFAAMSGTTWVRALFGECGRGLLLHNMAYGKQLNGAENRRQAAASRRLWATPWVRTQGEGITPGITPAHLCGIRRG